MGTKAGGKGIWIVAAAGVATIIVIITIILYSSSPEPLPDTILPANKSMY